MEEFAFGFEEDEKLRSSFIFEIIRVQRSFPGNPNRSGPRAAALIPCHIIQYWHNERAVPEDVRACLNSWRRLEVAGFRFTLYNDASAAAYIANRYTSYECAAFARCHHPAMRCDYLRMCVLVAEGGFYVDADEFLLGEDWRQLFIDNTMKVQPLCYDIPTATMVSADEVWQERVSTHKRVFYVNNNPIAAPPGHAVLRLALKRATEKLLGSSGPLEIQSTTGPGNLTAALAAHARGLMLAGQVPDFELMRNWGVIAETRWDLSYRYDARNWRNIGAA